jgi:phage-related protein
MASNYEILLNIGGKLSGSLKQSTTATTKALQGIQKTSNLVKTAIVGALGYVSVRSAVTFGKSCVEAAETAEKAQTQLNTVLASTKGVSGMTADSANALAKSLSAVTTYGKSTIVSTENLLLTFTGIGKDVMPNVTEAALNMSTALGQDTSTSAMQLGKALNDPVKGIAKLTKVGVVFTDAQKKQITAMQKAGDVAGAQKVILAELNTEFGNSARAAATTSEGRKIRIENAIKGIKSSIGTKLLPIIDKVTTVVSNNLPQIMDGVDKVMEHLQPVIEFVENKIVPGVGNAIKNVIIPAIKIAYKVVKTLVDFIATHQTLFKIIAGAILAVVAAMVIWKAIMTVFWGIFNAFRIAAIALNIVMSLNPIALIIIAVVALVAAFMILWKKSAAFRNFWIGLWDGIKAAAKAVGDWFGGAWTTVVDAIKTAFSGIGEWFSGLWSGVTSVFKSVINFFIDNLNGIIGGIDTVTGAISKATNGKINLTIQKIPRLANGGIVKHRSGGILANIAEGGHDEAVIPLKKGLGGLGGGNFTFSPKIIIQGNASKEDVSSALDDAQADFERRMAIYEKNKRRKAYAT